MPKRARPNVLPVRLDEEERSLVIKGARLAGVPIAQFIRDLIHEGCKEDEALSNIEEAVATACDISSDLEVRRAAMLSIVGKAMARSLALRGGYSSAKEIRMWMETILAISGMPSAHVKVTEDLRGAVIHAKAKKTWEEMVDEAHGNPAGSLGNSISESGNLDSGRVVDISSRALPESAGRTAEEEVAS